MVEKKGALEVEVIRARGLVGKPGSKALPGNLSSHNVVITGSCVPVMFLWGKNWTLWHCLSCSVLSTLRKGLPFGEWSLHSQKENKSSKKNLGSSLSAATAVWGESRREGFTGTLDLIVQTLQSNVLQEQLLLNHFFSSALQVIVWGDYGRMDHKSFMGAVQILLDELDLSNMVIGWFKLFPPSSLVDPTLAPLTRRASQSSLDSFSRS